MASYRRAVVSGLVSGLHEVTLNAGPGRIFGISPAGNVENDYNVQCADVYLWCREAGYIDYICPQVYFGLEHERKNFVPVLQEISWN